MHEMLGRRRERMRLRSELAAARAGRARCVELVGEPGIGKTRLLAELGAQADRDGWLVLSGRGTEFETDVPFGIFIDALDDHVARLGAERVRRLSRDRLEELAAMLPALSASRSASGLGNERHRLHYAARALLEGLAAARPLLLALDDVHWCDAASLELLAHVVRRPPCAPLLLALAFRPRQAPAPLLRAGAAMRVALGPLEREAAEALIAGRVPAAQRDELYELSGGNPLFLDALARQSGVGVRDGGHAWAADLAVPDAVLAALRDKLAALSPRALALARGAAVAGEPFTPELAAAAGELNSGDALAALDELVSSELAGPTRHPREFRFRHPIVRQAIYESAGVGWRLGAHARAASLLSRQGAAPARRAHHLELSAQPGDRAALDVLSAAAADVAARAPSAAAHWWSAALSLLPADAPAEQRLALLVPMATSLGAAGELTASRDALREVLALVPAEHAALRGQVVAFIAMIEQLLGHQDEAHALLMDTLAAQPDPASPAATALRIELANERMFVTDFPAMRQHAAEALSAARTLDDPVLTAAAAGMQALAEYAVANLAQARTLLGEAVARLDALSDEQLATRLDAALYTGLCEHAMSDWDGVHRHFGRGLSVARATGQGYLLIPMTVGIASAHTWRGELTTATALADEGIDASRLAGNDQSLTWTLTLRCWIATLAGDLPLALETGERAAEAASRLSRTSWAAFAECYLGEAQLEAGDHEGCRERILTAAGGPELPMIERAFKSRVYEILTRAELAAGRLSAAEHSASQAAAAVSGLGLPGRTSDALRARAAVRFAHGDTAGATEAARAAARAAHQAEHRIDAARAHLLAGTALAASGERRQAMVALVAAESAFAEYGARRFRDQAARELRRLGPRVARQGRRRPDRPTTGLGALTDREREIAELVCAGHTNRHIAAHLYLSAKTVETHMANIFGKLGVRSRAAVAAAVAQGRSARRSP